MHAVGDAGDRHLVAVEARPEAAEHLAAHDAVQLADAVGALREPQPHVRHVEHVGVLLGAEAEDAVDGHPLAGVVAAEVVLDQLEGEPVDPGRHRRVRGEDRAGADGGERLVEVESLVLGQLSDPLEAEEPGVALVGVEHLGLGVPAQLAVRADRADATDAEQHLLQQSVVSAAAVQPVGDLALRRRVVLDVRVEHEQRDAADLRAPDLCAHGAVVGETDTDLDRLAVLLAQERQRKTVGSIGG